MNVALLLPFVQPVMVAMKKTSSRRMMSYPARNLPSHIVKTRRYNFRPDWTDQWQISRRSSVGSQNLITMCEQLKDLSKKQVTKSQVMANFY